MTEEDPYSKFDVQATASFTLSFQARDEEDAKEQFWDMLGDSRYLDVETMHGTFTIEVPREDVEVYEG